MQPVEVKVKMHNKRDNLRKRNAHPKQKPWRTAKPMIDREAAWCLLTEFTQSESLRKHALAVEACMRACARKRGNGSPDAENLWGIVGLIHDFDYERWPSPEEHPYKGNEILQERGYSDEIRRAIRSHAEYSGVARYADGKIAIRLRRTSGIHHRRRTHKAGKVAGRGRRQVCSKKNERQSLCP